MAKNGGSEDGTEHTTAEEVLKPLNDTRMKEILKARRTARDDRKHINTELAKKISEVVGDKFYLDRTMLPTVEKLFNMKDERLAYHLDNLLFMLDVSGISDRAKKIARLPLAEGGKRPARPPRDEEDEAEAAGASANVRPFPAPASVPGA